MKTTELRQRIKDYVEEADERILNIINAIIETEIKTNEMSESQKEILDERLTFHKENPSDGKNWEEVKKGLEAKYDL